jgi:hypothetical protein
MGVTPLHGPPRTKLYANLYAIARETSQSREKCGPGAAACSPAAQRAAAPRQGRGGQWESAAPWVDLSFLCVHPVRPLLPLLLSGTNRGHEWSILDLIRIFLNGDEPEDGVRDERDNEAHSENFERY